MTFRRYLLLLAVGFGLMVSGCLPSVHPFYTEDDLLFEPALVGAWKEEDGEEVWEVKKESDKSYLVTFVDEKQRQGKFTAHLLKIGGALFLDMTPQDGPEDLNWYYGVHFMPVHTAVRIYQIDPQLETAVVDMDWLGEILKNDPGALKHERMDEDGLLITAAPAELQAFLLKHLSTEDAFSRYDPLKRHETNNNP